MVVETIFFYILAAAIIGSALAVVALRNIINSALFLVVLFAAAAGIYILLNAEFIAIVQILIYAGAITILILFAIMLTQQATTPLGNLTSGQWGLALLVCALIAGGIIWGTTVRGDRPQLPGAATVSAASGTTNPTQASAPSSTAPNAQQATATPGVNNVARIGQLLYSPSGYSYVLPFEIASLVLLVSIMGAIIIGRED